MESAADFIEAKFLDENRVSRKVRSIYSHYTTATDTKLVERVFTNVTEIILNDILKGIGLH